MRARTCRTCASQHQFFSRASISMTDIADRWSLHLQCPALCHTRRRVRPSRTLRIRHLSRTRPGMRFNLSPLRRRASKRGESLLEPQQPGFTPLQPCGNVMIPPQPDTQQASSFPNGPSTPGGVSAGFGGMTAPVVQESVPGPSPTDGRPPPNVNVHVYMHGWYHASGYPPNVVVTHHDHGGPQWLPSPPLAQPAAHMDAEAHRSAQAVGTPSRGTNNRARPEESYSSSSDSSGYRDTSSHGAPWWRQSIPDPYPQPVSYVPWYEPPYGIPSPYHVQRSCPYCMQGPHACNWHVTGWCSMQCRPPAPVMLYQPPPRFMQVSTYW
ncbi:hypothetical protein OH76DRAFT_767666 [Lentinus brumalis]|uniref:Uncharacterized protein n=1 Tax=Lentinus brumalis TaxID=2498619 RepID=A0A371D4L6_9APHY|nr:hypothetical protein OH76DRAFT_767666 [Polyporus brumalis]